MPSLLPNKIDASPTKEFFISMLVRDIDLTRAILDLVDNSWDGARRIRPDGNYNDLWVKLTISRDRFQIEDNCGGMTVEIARECAFRFGRTEQTPQTPRSIGRFGVGMKRAIFKMGNYFKITSQTENSRFVVAVDVEQWKQQEDWEFEFQMLDENAQTLPTGGPGTCIEVTQLRQSVSENFALENFVTRLRNELEAAHQQTTEMGLTITLNGMPIAYQAPQLLESDVIHPARKEISTETEPPISVRLFAGLWKPDPNHARWYIYCNGRMILEADQSNLTGWGERNGQTIPKYHNQFAEFRGYVFFDCDDAFLLPWNTTKTGVDLDSPVYGRVKQEMIRMLRSVIDFLREKDRERDEETQPLHLAVQTARPVRLLDTQASDSFTYSREIAARRASPPTRRIQYDRPTDQVQRAMGVLRVTTLKEVGEKTFDYFYGLECE
jgi:hypothetical protein